MEQSCAKNFFINFLSTIWDTLVPIVIIFNKLVEINLKNENSKWVRKLLKLLRYNLYIVNYI